ncbi:MAG: nitrilase-related carbon-nitrogen hydrolase, partial [Pseudomonadota bacterium]|nr:nitrilase-related carbon-nitrogen hydrolase [Pseudomonadota bacterium]
CGENTNPLARYSLMAEGEQIHISSYPPVWPTHEPLANAAYDLANAIRIRAGAHSFEAKAFNVVASSIIDTAALKVLAPLGREALTVIEKAPRGVSMIIDPSGKVIAETSSAADELLMAELDLAECVVPKQFHDVVGYYNRFDVFSLKVDRTRRPPVEYADNDAARVYPFDVMEKLEIRTKAAE